MHTGEKIRRLISAKRISVTELSKRINRTRQTIYRWMDGSHISETDLQKLAEALDTTPQEIRYNHNQVVTNRDLHERVYCRFESELNARKIDLPPDVKHRLFMRLLDVAAKIGDDAEGLMGDILDIATH